MLEGVGSERCTIFDKRLVGAFEYELFDPGPLLGSYHVLRSFLEKFLLKVLSGL